MRSKWWLFLLVSLAFIRVNAITFSPKEFFKSGDLGDLFTPSLNEYHKKIADKVFEVMDTKEKQWKVERDPKEYPAYTKMYFIPKNSTTENSLEQLIIQDIREDEVDTLEEVYSDSKKILNFPASAYEIISQSPNQLVYQMRYNYPKNKVHIIGVISLKGKKKFWLSEFTALKRIMDENEVDNIVTNLKKIEWKMSND